MNRQTEIDAVLRKPPSELEILAERHTDLFKSILYVKSKRTPLDDKDFVAWKAEFAEIEKRLTELRQEVGTAAITEALNAAQEKERKTEVDMAAMARGFAKLNPGKTRMEYGGEETQKLYDMFAAAPPSASINRVDKLVCGYCSKSSAEKLMLCAQCRAVAYCGRDCQKAAWKAHKKYCQPKADGAVGAGEPKQPKLPLTWEQLEAFQGAPAAGKMLEVRVMSVMVLTRQVLECKDRVGAVRRIAVYTDSRSLPGAAAGKILRWKNPRYHWFIDGSSGARIEDEDLPDVTITNA